MNTKKRYGRLICGSLATFALMFAFGGEGAAQDEGVKVALEGMLDQAKEAVEAITSDELALAIEGGRDLHIVDCRTEADYTAGHLPGAVWIPRGKMEFMALRGKVAATDDEIVLYCRIDGRSSLAAVTLKRLGYTRVRYLKGGFKSWVTSGHSIYNVHGELTVKEFEKAEDES